MIHWTQKFEYNLKQAMQQRAIALLGILFFASQLQSQVLDNSFLSGRYGFRQLLLATNPSGQPIEARGLVAVASFDGRGGYSFQGTRNLGVQGPSTYNGSGNYSVSPAGFVAMSNPLDTSSTLNLRLANGLLLGSTTDSSGNLFDLFVAVPLPASGGSTVFVTGNYAGVSLEIPSGLFNNVKNCYFRFTADGKGSAGSVTVSGQAVQSGNRVLNQQVGPSTYGINGDSTGFITFPATAPNTTANQLLSGDKQIFVSANGEYMVGGSVGQGSHDFFFAMRTPTTPQTNASFQGLYYAAGLKVELSRPASFAGAVNALGNGKAVWTRRSRLPEGNVDATAVNDYTINSDGVGAILTNRFAINGNGNIFIQAGTSYVDSNNYEIVIGAKTRTISGTGVFLVPTGALNGASFAPVGSPIAPGQFLALFGTGLGPANPVVASAPFPNTLGGVTVTIQDRPAPIYFVSANQMSVLVPFATSGTSAEIVVRNGTQESNRVTVPVSRTSPGIYSQPQNGIGPGAVLKSDFSLLTSANPARRGDTILIYLTGLGTLDPALRDGVAASTTVLSRVTDSVNVYIGGIKATVSFAGAAPGFAGLYQLNVVVPNGAPVGSAVALAVETSNAFHDMVDIAIAPSLP